MTTASDDLIVITGGPGAGKTTLINLLRAAGFATAPEAGRAIIQAQLAIGGPALPWTDSALYAELKLSWEIRSYRWAQLQPGPVFFDHAIPSLPGYYRVIGQPVPEHVEAAVVGFPYRKHVFIAPPWPAIYRNDTERRQTLDQAHRVYEAMVDCYVNYSYQLIELPRVEPRERLRFVLDYVTTTATSQPDDNRA